MDGCRCPQCFSLAEYMLETTGQDYGLAPAAGHAPGGLEEACSGTYACSCTRCSTQRAALTSAPRPTPRQPWEVQHAA